jgi:hypothetical protein
MMKIVRNRCINDEQNNKMTKHGNNIMKHCEKVINLVIESQEHSKTSLECFKCLPKHDLQTLNDSH